MFRLRNISIKFKVSLVAIIAFLSLIIYMIEVQEILRNNNATLANVHDTSFPILRKLGENRKYAFDITEITGSAIVQQNADLLKNSRYHIGQSQANLHDIGKLDEGLATKIVEMEDLLNVIANTGIAVTEGSVYKIMEPEVVEEKFFEMEDAALQYTDNLEVAIELEQIRLKKRLDNMLVVNEQTMVVNQLFGITIAMLLIVASYIIVRHVRSALKKVITVADRIAEGDLSTTIQISSRDETGHLLEAIEAMRNRLKQQQEQKQQEQFTQTQMIKVSESLRGDMSIQELGNKLLPALASSINAQIAMLYCLKNNKTLSAVASMTAKIQPGINDSYTIGDSLVGQCALMEKQMLIDAIPDHYMNNQPGFEKVAPGYLLFVPIHFNNKLIAVIELGAYRPFTLEQLAFIDTVRESIGIAINTALSSSSQQQSQPVTQQAMPAF